MRKIVLSLLVGSALLLAGCSNSNNASETKETSEVTSSTTKQSETKESTAQTSTSSSEEKAEQEIAKEANDSYQSILTAYTKKLQQATPGLIEEYNQEAVQNQNGLEGLAAISNSKVEDLAKISNEGISEMAEIHLTKGSGKYEDYEGWSSKLMDVYTVESNKIMDAYLASTMSGSDVETADTIPHDFNNYNDQNKPTSNTGDGQQTQYSYSSVAQEEYTTVQDGEGPNQVAARVGISADQLFELNGMDPNNFMMYPGQQVRVK